MRARPEALDKDVPEMKSLIDEGVERDGLNRLGSFAAANNKSCTPVAFWENSEKLTPPGCGVAPSGCDEPGVV
jgi:hypothetical protein